NTTGGAKSFTGLITDGNDGDGGGISITGNSAGASFGFTGGVVLSTGANSAFTATGAGTLNLPDPAGAGNQVVTTTTGTAVNITGVTIGASGVTWESVNSTTAGGNVT